MRFTEFTARRNGDQRAPARLRVLSGPDAGGPIVLAPAQPEVDAAEWAWQVREEIHDRLFQAGAVVLRGCRLADAADFDRIVRAIARTGELMDYVENTSPRATIHGKVKTSTEHPADQDIVLHNEHSFSHIFPSKLFLYCRTAPASGGETPLADCRRIRQRLPESIRETFRRKGGYLYVRNFGSGFGPDWPTVFQTTDRQALERYLQTHDIGFEWLGADRLRVRYRRATEVTHPITGEAVWFNHVLFWHVSSLERSVRDMLLQSFDEWDLPNQAFYGDGSSIEPDVIETIREAYAAETIARPWQEHDLLLVDNLLCAHGRRPYSGARLIMFAMADPWTRSEVGALECP